MYCDPNMAEKGVDTRFKPGNKAGEANKGKKYQNTIRNRILSHAAKLPEDKAPHEKLFDIYTNENLPPELVAKAAKWYQDIVDNQFSDEMSVEVKTIHSLEDELREMMFPDLINKEVKEDDSNG